MATKKKVEVADTEAKKYTKLIEEKLNAEEKVSLFLSSADFGGASFAHGVLSGYKFKLATDQTLMVPASIAALFEDNRRNRNASAQRFRKEAGQDVEIRRY